MCIIKLWIRASNGRDAPTLDLALYKDLLEMKSLFPEKTNAALKKLQNHTWYLTPEVAVFSFCSNMTSDLEKSAIACKLLENKQKEFIPRKPDLPALHPDVSILNISSTSWLIFDKLELSGSFLNLPVCEWDSNVEYRKLMCYVSTVKVVNDAAERGVKLCSDIIYETKNETTRNDMMQVIEYYRQTVKSTRKKNMLEELGMLTSNNNN